MRTATPSRHDPSRYDRLSDRAYATLSEAIGSGSLAPGTRLTEHALCKRLKVGRSPVREALLRLAGDGLVDALPNAGFHVRRISVDECLEEYRIRAALESAAVRIAVEKGFAPHRLDQLERCCARMRQAIAAHDHARAGAADLEFHQALVALADSRRLESAFRGGGIHMLGRTSRDDRAGAQESEGADVRMVDEHLALVRALARRDAAAAIAILDDHAERSIAAFRRSLAADVGERPAGRVAAFGPLVPCAWRRR